MTDRVGDLPARRAASRDRRAVSGAVGTNLFITLTLLTLISAIGVGASMWLYGLFNVAAWLFVYFRMPDLTGRSLEEIEGKLGEGKFKPADFAR